MPYRLGIDLGTTFTAAAICRQAPDGTVLSELVPLGARTASVPSVLFVSQGTTLVGEAAERRALTDPGCVVRDFKRRLGDDTPIVVGDEPHHAHELAASLVQWVVDRVTEREGELPDAIAVTYPAAWGPHRKTVLQNALGPDVLLLTEPQAAALHYASAERVEPGSTIAVYDLGGGTFDAAVVHKTVDGDFELLGPPGGIECLGGVDFDDAVLSRVLPAAGCSDPVAMARLRRECTEAKEALSADVSAVVPVLLPDFCAQVPLSRAEFESLISPILAETVESLSRAISAAGLRTCEVTSVLLVGGSSRIPLVTDLISSSLDRPVAVDTDPKGVVALGAALAAHRSTIIESYVDSLIPEPRRPDHDCDPPALQRPRRRLRRTRVILYTLGMLILALAVIPSPFTSDTKTSSTPKKEQPTQAGSPAGPNGATQPGSTRKRTPKAQQAGVTSTGDSPEAAAGEDALAPGQTPVRPETPGSPEVRTQQSPADSSNNASPSPPAASSPGSSTATSPAGSEQPPPPPPDPEPGPVIATEPPPAETTEEPPPPPQQTEAPPPPPDPEPSSADPPPPTETS